MRTSFQYKKLTVAGHPNADEQGHVLEHILIAERAIGRHLPRTAVVHHVDENTRNKTVCRDCQRKRWNRRTA